MNRKNFLKSLGLLTAGVATSPVSGITRIKEIAAAKPQQDRRKVIGIQLWSVRQLMNDNVQGTLKGLADCGYLAIEGVGYANSQYFRTDINEFDKMVKGLGMQITSSHLSGRYTPETKGEALDWWKDTADKHKAIGCNTMVLPSLPGLRGVTRDQPQWLDYLKQLCDFINEVAVIAKERGMRYGFHNHAADEEIMSNGRKTLDFLIENTDPSFFIQLDNHNMMTPHKSDPIAFLNKYQTRVKVLHVKDDNIIGASGNTDFEKLFTTAAQYNIYEPIVEVENYPMDVMECMRRSCAFLLAAPYVRYFG